MSGHHIFNLSLHLPYSPQIPSTLIPITPVTKCQNYKPLHQILQLYNNSPEVDSIIYTPHLPPLQGPHLAKLLRGLILVIHLIMQTGFPDSDLLGPHPLSLILFLPRRFTLFISKYFSNLVPYRYFTSD